jgi:plasmid stability protein
MLALQSLPALLALTAILCYSLPMATLTIRNLDEKTKRALQVRAALNGRSMEAEVREMISSQIADKPAKSVGLGTAIHDLFAPLGGVELQIPPRRKSHRQTPTFGE